MRLPAGAIAVCGCAQATETKHEHRIKARILMRFMNSLQRAKSCDGGGEKSADAPVGLFAPLPSWVAPSAQRGVSSAVRVDPVQNRLPHHWVFWHQSQDRFGGRPPASAQPSGAAGEAKNAART